MRQQQPSTAWRFLRPFGFGSSAVATTRTAPAHLPPHARVAEPESPSLGPAILAQAQATCTVIQHFLPLAESLELELGQEYVRQRGNKAFLSDHMPVPFVINNAGTR